ncbi:MAG: dTDP-4-dehydrorhamnose 3,5-epimerase family protein [Bacillota bacterium]
MEGVIVKPLKFICDARGRLLEIFRRDDPFFQQFGQVYISTAYPGVIKAWHYHRLQTDHFAVLSGMARIVLFDYREDSHTKGDIREYFAGAYNPLLIRIPPLVVHGFQALGTEETLLLNCPSEPYNRERPDEYRLPLDDPRIPYCWKEGEKA